MNAFSNPWVLCGAVTVWLILGGVAAVHAINAALEVDMNVSIEKATVLSLTELAR